MKQLNSLADLATNAAWSTVAHLLGRGSLVVASIILARNLNTTDFAAYSYFQLTVSMLAGYAAMGLGVTASRFFAESSHVDENKMPPVGTLWAVSMVMGLLFSLVVLCMPKVWLDGGLSVPNWLLALGIFSVSLGVVPGGGILGLERYAEATATAAISAIVLILGSVIAGISDSAIGAMFVFVAVSLLTAVGNAVVVVRKMGVKRLLRHARFSKTDFRNIASFAGPMVGVSFLAVSGSWLVGRMILGGPAGEEGFALYAIGLQWFSLALFLPSMITRVILPRIVKTRLDALTLPSRSCQHLTRQGALLALYAALIVSITGTIFSPWLLELYGGTFKIDKWVLAVFMLAAIPSAPANTLGNAIVAADGQKEWFGMTIIWFICLLLTTKILLINGAWSGAFAHAIASLLLIVMAFAIARKKGLL